MSDLNVALILRFIDQATGPARAALRNVQGAAERVERFGTAQVAAGRQQVALAGLQMSALRGQALALTAVGYAAYRALGPSVEFEAQMSRVAAIARASAGEQERLTATARELGRSTPFTAVQAAQGMEYLAMAGFDTNQTIAAMPGLLNLAAAAGSDLGRTSDIASNILSGFNLQADQTGRLGDVLVNTFTTSNTTLEMLGATMSYVAPQAAAAGVGLEQTAAMAGLLGNQGIQGERAGTALRAMLARLVAPSNEAAAALEQLNVQVSDDQGNLRDIPTVLAEMDRAMQGMGSATRQELLTTIFGVEASTAALILTSEAGSGALQDYAGRLHESGTAAETAARMNDNARGALLRLSSAAQDAQISLGDALLPALADLAEQLVPIVQGIGNWIEAHPLLVEWTLKGAAALVAFNGAILILRGAFWLLFGWVGKVRIALGLLMRFGGNFTLGAIEGAFAALRLRAGRDMVRLGDTVVSQAGRMESALSRVRTGALMGAMALAWNVMRAPTDPEAIGDFQEENARRMNEAFRSLPGVRGLVSMYENLFQRVHGRDAPVPEILLQGPEAQAAARTVQSYAGRTDLPTGQRLADLRDGAAAIRAEVAALEDQLAALPAPADAYDMGSPAYQQAAAQLAARREELRQVEAALAEAETQAAALGNALRVLSETDVTPEINTQSIDRALERVRRLADQVQRLEGGASVPAPGGAPRPDGARATGGPVRPGFWYNVNENGIESIMPLTPMRVIPAGESRRLMASAGGAAQGGGLQVGDITIHAAPGMDAMAIAREVRRQIEDLAREARFALHDGGLHA